MWKIVSYVKEGIKKNSKYILYATGLSSFLVVLYLVVSSNYSIGFSNTPSMRTFVFIMQKKSRIIKDGYCVVFPAPKNIVAWKKYYDYSPNHYHYKPGMYFVKFIGCSEGQILNTVGRKDYCNGKFLAEIPEYLFLIPVPHVKIKGFPVWRNYRIPKGKIFVVSPDRYGLDSRYFDLINVKRVKYNAVPLYF